MYGLPYLFPQTYCLEKNPVDVGKNLASFSTPEISHSPNNSNFHVITLSLLLYHFFFNFRHYVQVCNANFHQSMVTESYLQHGKSNEWSKFLQTKFKTLFLPFNAI